MSKTNCRAKNKRGEPCRAAAGAGGLCHLHANPDLASTLGRQGGRRNGRFSGVPIEVPANMTASDLNALGSRTISLVLSGDLKAREAGAVAQLINVQARIIPLVDFERRFADLQRQVMGVLAQDDAKAAQCRELPTSHEATEHDAEQATASPTECNGDVDSSKDN